jgi:Sel1 repeat-containing protein
MRSLRSVLLAALGAGFIVVSAATVQAGDPLAKQGVATDKASAALLQKVVQQIVAGRTVSPLEDNALATWEGIRKQAQDLTPGTARALEDFVSLSESRAETERQAGREMVAFDLRAFADMAQELLQRSSMHPATQDAQPTAAAAVQASPPPTTAPPITAPQATGPLTTASVTTAPLADNVPPPRIEPAAAPVKVPTGDTMFALATPKPPAPLRAPPMQDQTAAQLTSRGDAMLAIKDISAARKLYEQAANLGNAAAAKGLARTYDPDYIRKLGVIGMRPDVTMAVSWYDRAAALGDRESAQRMQQLDAMAGTGLPGKDAR